MLIPEAYYEATVLTKLVDKPCIIGEKKLCRHFAYPSLSGFPTANVSDMVSDVTDFINDPEVSYVVSTSKMFCSALKVFKLMYFITATARTQCWS